MRRTATERQQCSTLLPEIIGIIEVRVLKGEDLSQFVEMVYICVHFESINLL